MTRHFGSIEGIPVGASFESRKALSKAGVHRPTMGGICGTPKEGAESIVLSGGYEDDRDDGDMIIYTGHGGNDPATKKQVADQELAHGNLALVRNATSGLPVRVSRGARLDSGFAPSSGFRYDGLYVVEEFWHEQGRSGFRVWRFRLRRDDPAIPIWAASQPSPQPCGPAPRRQTTTMRVIRNTRVAQAVKELHDYTCQMCGVRLETSAGGYAEGAHIQPLGQPHNGPDVESNVLCLCPNHHLLFDMGAVGIQDDLSLIGMPGTLRVVSHHVVDRKYFTYHREHFGLLV